MTKITKLLAMSLLAAMPAAAIYAQDKEEMLNCGNMDQWLVREIEESFVIGGNTKTLHEIAPYQVIKGDRPYTFNVKSPWATSNVMAKVAGIVKCSTSVFPEKRGDGKCARMETLVEQVKVLGMVDITVLASGKGLAKSAPWQAKTIPKSIWCCKRDGKMPKATSMPNA